MDAMFNNDDKPVLRLSDVRAWQTRAVEIAEAMQSLNEEATQISRKLDAVRVIMGVLPTDDVTPPDMESSGQEAEDDIVAEPFPDTVIRAVREIGGAPEPSVIRRWIREHGPTTKARERADTQYIYTCLMRHAEGKRLIKVGNGYSLPTSSPKGEAGGVAPPALPHSLSA
jgi:hypothetical protein